MRRNRKKRLKNFWENLQRKARPELFEISIVSPGIFLTGGQKKHKNARLKLQLERIDPAKFVSGADVHIRAIFV